MMFKRDNVSYKQLPLFGLRRALVFACSLNFLVHPVAFSLPQAASDKAGARGKTALSGQLSSTTGATMQAVRAGKNAGQCPLQHTSITARVNGFVAEVEVKQTYKNPFKNAIETVYTFPLPNRSAVDEIVLQTGSRVVTGTVKSRNAAAQIYNASRAQGYSAALVTEERPNIFTCRVANIQPLSTVMTTVKYSQPLRMEAEGKVSLGFPLIVSPRYVPGNSLARVSSEDPGVAAATDRVPDASAITPVAFKPSETKTYGLSFDALVQWPADIKQVSCNLPAAKIRKISASSVALNYSSASFPNRDVCIVFRVDPQHLPGSQACLTGRRGFVTALLPALPPPVWDSGKPAELKPAEYIFIVDRSSNQAKTSLSLAKELVGRLVELLSPASSFQIIAFSALPSGLFSKMETATPANKQRAKMFLSGLKSSEGEDVIDAIAKACRNKITPGRPRIVVLISDGNVGNDFEVLEALKQVRGQSRWFVVGTGYSANQFLLEEIARIGEGRYLEAAESAMEPLNGKQSSTILMRLLLRLQLLMQPEASAELKVAAQGLELSEMMKDKAYRFWYDSPVLVFGKFKTGGPSLIRVRGSNPGAQDNVSLLMLPKEESKNQDPAKLWAMNAAFELMDEHWIGLQQGRFSKRAELTELAEDHQIVTPVTALVAVDGLNQAVTGKVQAVHVPILVPEGVSYKLKTPIPQ